MLKAVINNYELDIAQPVSVVMQSPWLGSESTYSLGIVFYNTPETREILGDLHLPEYARNKIEAINGTVLTDALSMNGAFHFKSANNQYFEYDFVGAGNFYDELKNIDIRDIDYEDYEGLSLQFYDKTFFEELGFYTQVTNATINPQVKLIWEKILETIPFKCSQNDLFTIDNFEKLYFFSINDPREYTLKEQITSVEGPAEVTFSADDDKIVITAKSGTPFQYASDGDYCKIYNLNISAHKLNNRFAKIDSATSTALTLADLDANDFDLTSLEGMAVRALPFSNWPESLNINNHIPEYTGYEILQDFQALFNMQAFPQENGNKFRLLFIKDIINSKDFVDITDCSGEEENGSYNENDGYSFAFEGDSNDNFWSENIKEIEEPLVIKDAVSTFEDLPISGSENNDLRFVEDENSYYKYEKLGFALTYGWQFYCKKPFNITEGNGDVSITSKIAPMLTYIYNGKQYIRYEAPAMLINFNELNNEVYRMFFWYGENALPAPDYHDMALCTSDIYGHDGQPIEGATWAIKWDGDYGLIKLYYEDYLLWELNIRKDFTCKINWPMELLNNFDFAKKYRINYTNYFVKSIKFTIHRDKIVFGDTELAKA